MDLYSCIKKRTKLGHCQKSLRNQMLDEFTAPSMTCGVWVPKCITQHGTGSIGAFSYMVWLRIFTTICRPLLETVSLSSNNRHSIRKVLAKSFNWIKLTGNPMNGDRVPCHLAEGLNMELKMAVQGLRLKAFNSRNAEWIASKLMWRTRWKSIGGWWSKRSD